MNKLTGPYSIDELRELQNDKLPLTADYVHFWYYTSLDLAGLINNALETNEDFLMTVLKEMTSGTLKSISIEIERKPTKLYKKFE